MSAALPSKDPNAKKVAFKKTTLHDNQPDEISDDDRKPKGLTKTGLDLPKDERQAFNVKSSRCLSTVLMLAVSDSLKFAGFKTSFGKQDPKIIGKAVNKVRVFPSVAWPNS